MDRLEIFQCRVKTLLVKTLHQFVPWKTDVRKGKRKKESPRRGKKSKQVEKIGENRNTQGEDRREQRTADG